MMTLEAAGLRSPRRPFPDSLRKPKPLTTAEWVEAIEAVVWQHAQKLDRELLLEAFRMHWRRRPPFYAPEPTLLDLAWAAAAFPEDDDRDGWHPAAHPHPHITETVAEHRIMELAPDWLPGAGGSWYQRSGSVHGTNGEHKHEELYDLPGLTWVDPDTGSTLYRALRQTLRDAGWWGAEWVGGGTWGISYRGWLLPTEWVEELRRVECVREAQMLAWRQRTEPCLCDGGCRCRPNVRRCECDVTTCDCDCRHDL